MALTPGTLLGKYTIRRQLAEGGMGEIYLGKMKGPAGFEKDVVIKRIRPFLANDSEFVKMFVAEARLASMLEHPNLVQIFDFFEEGGTYNIAMEYVRGRSLRDATQRCRERASPFPIFLAAHIAAEIAQALHSAHTKMYKGAPLGLVHRDCTPHNILLSFEGAVKLADFGIAKASNKTTQPGTLKGKFAYMSPEQTRGEEIDARTDVFALGIVLWELLTGMRLFTGDSDMALIRAVQQSVIAPPRRLNPDVPEELNAIVLGALERDREKRLATAHELEWKLTQFLHRQATTSQNTDVGDFLRGLFAEELAGEAAHDTDSKPSSRNGTLRLENAIPRPLDEDSRARTYVLEQLPGPRVPEQGLSSQSLRRWRRIVVPFIALICVAAVVTFVRLKSKVTSAPPSLAGEPNLRSAPPLTVLVPAEETAGGAAAPPTEGEPAPQNEADPKTAEPLKAAAPEKPVAARRTSRGQLLVHVQPWAKMYIDEKSFGLVGGTQKFFLSTGTHRVRFEYLGQSKEVAVQIQPGKVVDHIFQAEAAQRP